MAIFLKFNDVNYKAPNQLDIGRGQPFHNQDHEFSRDHCVIIKNSQGVFIKKKKKQLKLKINDQVILDCKFHKLLPGALFYIGNSCFELLATEPTQYEEIKLIKMKSRFFSSKYIFTHLMIIFSICCIGYLFTTPDALRKLDLWDAVFCIITILGIYLYSKLLGLINQENETLAKEIIIHKDGLSITFVNESNFSFKYIDVNKWSHKGNLTTINCYNRVLRVISTTNLLKSASKEQKGDLPYYLFKNIPHKEASSNMVVMLGLRLLTIFPFGFLLAYVYTDSLKIIYANYFVSIFFPVILFLVLRRNSFRELWYFYKFNDSKYKQKQDKLYAILLVAYFMVANLNWKNHKNLDKVHSIYRCKREMICDHLDYSTLADSRIPTDKNILKAAQINCKQGNKIACSIVSIEDHQRNIASE